MFIYQWFERIGNVVAPDESYQEQQQQQQHESPLFAVVAPDPNFATPHKQHSQTENETVLQTPDNTVVQCQHCRRLTPSTTTTTTTTPSLRSTPTPRRNALVQTPTGSSSLSLLSPPDHIQQFRLHQASQQTELIKSPRFKHKDKLKSFFYLVADPLHFKPKKDAAKIRKFLQDYPHWLLEARTSNFGTMVENGYTPLQAAAHCNHLEACKILLEHHDSAKEQLLQTTVSGKTALHIATEKGHVEVATLLVETMKQLDLALTVVDVMQRTPLGMALSSPEPKAYSSRKQVLELLYQPDDPSILGDRAPLDERCFTCQDHTIVVAHSDMPGMRVDMEDAMLLQVSPKVVLLGVLDGHGDGGQCSAFCAQELETELTSSSSSNNNNDSGDDNTATMMMIDVDALTQAFLAVDDRLAKTTVPGGSTGVVAVIHDTQILVANAGDSRCILIQKQPTDISEDMAKLSLSAREQKQESSSPSSFIVKALSEDHKPNRPDEQERITKAGLQVIEDHGIARVALKKEFGNDMLATSRGFGDFEFKDNADWDDEHQAIIAKPDVVVHERTEADCFLVLACDGIFDVMTNDDVGKYVMSRFQSGLQAEEDFLLVKTADGLLRECLDLQSQDNMSVILVALNDMAKRLLETQSLPQTQLDHAFASGSSTVVVDNK